MTGYHTAGVNFILQMQEICLVSDIMKNAIHISTPWVFKDKTFFAHLLKLHQSSEYICSFYQIEWVL